MSGSYTRLSIKQWKWKWWCADNNILLFEKILFFEVCFSFKNNPFNFKLIQFFVSKHFNIVGILLIKQTEYGVYNMLIIQANFNKYSRSFAKNSSCFWKSNRSIKKSRVRLRYGPTAVMVWSSIHIMLIVDCHLKWCAWNVMVPLMDFCIIVQCAGCFLSRRISIYGGLKEKKTTDTQTLFRQNCELLRKWETTRVKTNKSSHTICKNRTQSIIRRLLNS